MSLKVSRFQKEQGVVVQIGLDDICEYHYLSYGDWRSRMENQHRHKQIPMSIACERFRYIGIDSDPGSISICSKNYSENSPIFINEVIQWPEQLQRILLEHGIDRIDVLAVDIEGGEKFLFRKGWDQDLMLPRYIAIEWHFQYFPKIEPYTLESSRLIFENAGYSLRIEEKTNTAIDSWKGSTIEQQWIKSSDQRSSAFLKSTDLKKEGSAMNPFFNLPNGNPLVCHVMGVSDAPSNPYYTLSHWAQKARNFCWMLKSTGHRVIYYGYESCEVECDEKVIVASENILMDAYPKYREKFGHIDINVEPDNPEGIEYLENRWAFEAGYALRQRYQPNDIIYWTVPLRGQRQLYQEVKGFPARHIEPGIGYLGAFLPYRIFQSTFIRDFHYGQYYSNLKWEDFRN